MIHANAPLTPTGRLRMVHRHLHEGIPQAHVAAEFRVSRPTVATWVARYRAQGEAGLQDRSSRPHRSPAQLDPALVTQILTLRWECKWSARRIHHHLVSEGHPVCLRTVGRWLHRLGISRLRDLSPTGENLRQRPQKIPARAPGHMVHLDVKKIGRIPEGGGWRAHGRDSEAGRASKRGSGRRVGYTYLHSAIDGHTRLAYTEALEDEKAVTTIGFFCRARAFFAAHGITVDRVVTDNGSNYRAAEFTQKVVSLGGRHHRIRPYTPRHNGKVERYNRLMVDEVLYARPYTSENQRREALAVWVNHYNYCESLSGWSGTGWQGERRAAPAPRPWLLQLFAPKGAFRWTCPTPVRGGRLSPGPLRWLNQKTVRPRIFGEVVTHHSIAPK